MPGRPVSYTEEQAREAIATSYSWAESLRKLGRCPSGGAWRVLKKYAELWSIPTDHFDPARNRETNLKTKKRPVEELLVEDSTCSRSIPAYRRVTRPPYEQLLAEIDVHGYCWVGRKYGVSDNAVRKWVKFYEREREAGSAGSPDAASVAPRAAA